MKMSDRSTAIWAVTLFVTTTSMAGDWPQFRGPDRDGRSRETHLLQEWPSEGPKSLWTISNLGVGFSGPAIVGDRLYISTGRGEDEFLVAFDLKAKGAPAELYATRIGPLFTWSGNNWNRGPNATPTVDGNLVYALGGFGDLICVDASTGKEVWRHNLPREFGGAVNPIGGGAEDPTPLGWGYAWAPLVDGDHLICVPGGRKGLLACFDKKSGKLIWQSTDVKSQAPYSSTLKADLGGIHQYVQAINSGFVGIAAADGKKLWEYRRVPGYDDVVIGTPIIHGDTVFCSVGFGQGCDLVRVQLAPGGFQANAVYSNESIQNRDGGMVLVEGNLYGYSENRGWICAELATGKILWSEKERFGRGSITYADGRLYCCAEKGAAVALIEASPKGFNEVGRLLLPQESTLRRQSGGMWTHPVIANGRLYLRDQEFLYCFDITH